MTQLKRLKAPSFWPVERKNRKYIVPPVPGAHSVQNSMPLGVVLRDVLKCAKTMKEARYILNRGLVSIDGARKKDKNFGAGVMDVLKVGDDSYRIIPGKAGFRFQKVSGGEATFKLMRVRNKKTLRKGRTQINFHDGRNMIVSKDEFRTGDVVVFDFQKKEIKQKIKFEEGSTIVVMKGRSRGAVGKIDGIKTTKGSKPNEVTVSIGSGSIVLPKDYVFVIGPDKPVITMGE
ncbi:MAG: 30S ribosomal protein S4e [Candidatus Aenigmarchaeota archaeon]|nr:30S ribosomal protein S4e [Candidatus Aenigmarchaeota archaeon]